MQKFVELGCFLSALLLTHQIVYAEEASPIAPGKVADEEPAVQREIATTKEDISQKTNWLGFNFGLGLSVTFDNGSDKRIASASLDENNIVRVDDEENSVARLLLEIHRFAPCDPRLWFMNEAETIAFYRNQKNSAFSDTCGIGPFVAIQPGESDIIDAASIGLMVGFKNPAWDGINNSSSFNIGVGLIVDPDGQILGDGIQENQPLPGNETEVRLKEKQQYGWLVLASFSF